jgi:hypothetical protein
MTQTISDKDITLEDYNDIKFKIEVRNKINKLGETILDMPNGFSGDSEEILNICPLTHNFVDGAYVRELFIPKDMFFVTKLHKKTHPFFIMKGCVSIYSEDGIKKIWAPFYNITKSGTKRVMYTHEDTVLVTVHVTNETDLAKIEEEIIAKDYKEVEAYISNIIMIDNGEMK